jgi:protease II
MFKLGSHDPFEYLKHKLWPKKGLGVKVPIWLMTIKSRELLTTQPQVWKPSFL